MAHLSNAGSRVERRVGFSCVGASLPNVILNTYKEEDTCMRRRIHACASVGASLPNVILNTYMTLATH
jgi:hypothetical protein